MKCIAIGDIHTKWWIIDKAEEIVDDYDKVIFVGDYADDWNSGPIDSIETWQVLKAFQDKHPTKVVVLSGNHDYIYANKTPTSQSGYNQVTQLLINDPSNKELKDWLANLPIIFRLDGVVYSHAGILYAWAERYKGEEALHTLWNDISPLWVRPEKDFEYYPYQVFGHTPSKTCWEVRPNVWCIDTFSTYPNGQSVGDQTILEIIDGKVFNKTRFEDNEW